MRKLKQAGLTLLIASMLLSNSSFYAFADVVNSIIHFHKVCCNGNIWCDFTKGSDFIFN